MAKAYSKEFKQDVLAIVAKADTTLVQIAKDFGISESVLYKWIKQNKIDNGKATGMTSFAAEEIRVLRRRNKLLEQEIEVMRAAAAYFAQDNLTKKSFYPLVLDLAEKENIPISVSCRVLKLSRQVFNRWRKQPISRE